MSITYQEFLEKKRITTPDAGFQVDMTDINPLLFDWQRQIVRWAIHRGRAALFEDCGTGKSFQQLEWSSIIAKQTDGPSLILAPLGVKGQTQREGEKFGIPVTICATQSDVRGGVNITNYEKLHHFDPDKFTSIVLDESSILKGFDGSTRRSLSAFSDQIPYRLACTATPAPNDLIEIINHAEFLGIMTGKEIIALFFTQDGNTTHKWRLKGHAKEAFWRWMATWAIALRKPSDLGYDDGAFILPALNMHQITVDAPEDCSFSLVPVEALTMSERRAARRDSLQDRVDACANIVNASDERWIVWCDLNKESEALTKAIYGAIEVTGSDTAEYKERTLVEFIEGKHWVLVSKSSIAGFGLNLQMVHNMAFVGLSDSYEAFYQAVRRCWRFGQKEEVNCYVITAETEGAVVKNIERKEKQSEAMMDSLVKEMAEKSIEELTGTNNRREEMLYAEDSVTGKEWKVYLGDSVKVLDRIADNSIGLSVFSPPFPSMYSYTNSVHDIGNCKSFEEMIEQFGYMIPKLLRVTMPGRSCCIHLTQSVAFKGVDGYIGIKDFRGRVISAMEADGWVYYGEVCIDKNPQVKAIRTKDAGLQFKSLATDSARMHMCLADYILQFRKPGDNPVPIKAGISEKYKNPDGWITQEEWIEWAAPVWYGDFRGIPGGIRETDVLNVAQARETNDERHLCPLQLGVIERCVKLWSNPGETVLSPFMGIGSEGYQAVKFKRKFVGIELKESYFRSAVRNIKSAEHDSQTLDLFSGMEDEE